MLLRACRMAIDEAVRSRSTQNQDYTASSPFNLNLDKSSEVFDRKHTINLRWYYTLPFGRGGKYVSGDGVLSLIVRGWYTSGIFTHV
jgi:hypothetical protein